MSAAQPTTDSAFAFSGFGTLGLVGKSGFGDLGFSRSSSRIGDASRLSALPDSRIGGQIDWDGGPRWEGAVQGVLLPGTQGAPIQEAVQQAYAGYRPMPDTRIRVGRTSPDIFLFSDSRHVGYALPFVRPPVDFYGFAPLASIDGIDLEQRWNTAGSAWRAHASAGSVRTSISTIQGSRLALRGSRALAASLTRESDGLLLKASYWRSQLRVDVGGGISSLRQALEGLRGLPVAGLDRDIDSLGRNLWSEGAMSYLAVAGQYETGPWTLIGELSHLSVPGSPLDARRGYLSLGWRQGAVNYYGIVSRVKPDGPRASWPRVVDPPGPAIGTNAAQQAQALLGLVAGLGNNFHYDQGTIGAGLRWDVAPRAALKLQVDRIDIRPGGGAAWRSNQGQAARGVLASILVDVVWNP